MTWFKKLLAAGAWLALAVAAQAAQASPVPVLVSILDGEATLLRESGRFAVAEGVRLDSGDLVETDAKARLLRLEFADGSLIDLGPATRVLVAPRLGARATAAAPHLYVLKGWFKLTTPAAAAAGSTAVAAAAPLVFTPSQALTLTSGQQVVSSEATAFQLFCESGAVTLQPRLSKSMTAVKLKTSESFAQLGADKPVVTPRPAPAFIQSVPRSFLDPLPVRAALFKGREVAPKRLADLGYDEVADWLSAEPLLRSYFVGQWRALARRPDFRAGLAARMRSHPEWDRVVFPEKYLPKPKPAPAMAPPMAPGTSPAPR